MKFLLIHSTGGDPNESFYPWLADLLRKRGHEVIIPQFPTPIDQTLENWLEVMEPYWKHFDSNLVLIGRSIGAPFILRLLEKSPQKVKAAFLLAGFARDLGNPDFTTLISTFVNKPFDWNKIRASCERFFVYHGDNDPIVPLHFAEEVATALGVKVQVVPDGEHLWFETFPEILPAIDSLG